MAQSTTRSRPGPSDLEEPTGRFPRLHGGPPAGAEPLRPASREASRPQRLPSRTKRRLAWLIANA